MEDKKYLFLNDYTFEPYTPNEEDNRLMGYIKRRHEEMNTYRQHREKQWEESEKRIYDRIITPVEKGEQDKEEAIRQPLEFTITYAKLAQVCRKVMTVIIKGVEKSDKLFEGVSQKVWEYKSREANLYINLYNAYKKAIDDGESYLKINYIEKYKTVKIPKEIKETEDETYLEDNMEEVNYCDYDGLGYELIDNKNFWHDESGIFMYTASGIGAVNECIIKHVDEFECFRDKFKDKRIYQNVECIIPTSRDSDNLAFYYNNEEKQKMSTEGRWVTWFEYYNVLQNKRVLFASNIPFYQGGLSIGRIPAVKFINILIPNRSYSLGDGEILRGITGFSNSIFNKMEQLAEQATDPYKFLASGINVDEVMEGQKIFAVKGNDAKTPVNFVSPPDITSGAQYMLDYIQRLLINVSGINYNNLNAEPNQTAFGMALQQEQTLTRLSQFVKTNELLGLKDLVEISWLLLQKFFPQKKARLIVEENDEIRVEDKYPKVKINGKYKIVDLGNDKTTLEFTDSDNEYSMFELRPEWIKGRNFDLEVVAGSMMDDMLLVKTEKLVKIFEMMMKNPVWAQKLSNDIPKYIIEAFGETSNKWLQEDAELEDSEVTDLELEWELLVSSEIPVDQIINTTTKAEQHSEFLRRQLIAQKDELSKLVIVRIQQAQQKYLELEQQQKLLKLKRGEKKDQLAQTPPEEQQNQIMGQSQPISSTPAQSPVGSIQQRAAELGGQSNIL